MSTEFTPLNPSNRQNPLTGEGVIGRYDQQGQRGHCGKERRNHPASCLIICPPNRGKLSRNQAREEARSIGSESYGSNSDFFVAIVGS